MKALIVTIMTAIMLIGCSAQQLPQTIQTAHTVDQASVAALNAFCSVAVANSDADLTKVCNSVLSTVNQTQAAVDTALAFITAILAKRAQQKAFEPEALREAESQLTKHQLEAVSKGMQVECHR